MNAIRSRYLGEDERKGHACRRYVSAYSIVHRHPAGNMCPDLSLLMRQHDPAGRICQNGARCATEDKFPQFPARHEIAEPPNNLSCAESLLRRAIRSGHCTRT